MELIECASAAVRMEFKNKKVVNFEEFCKNIYTATVTSSSSHHYAVELHIDHSRKSKCNCPHADEKNIIYKHIVATYFTVLPKGELSIKFGRYRLFLPIFISADDEEFRQIVANIFNLTRLSIN